MDSLFNDTFWNFISCFKHYQIHVYVFITSWVTLYTLHATKQNSAELNNTFKGKIATAFFQIFLPQMFEALVWNLLQCWLDTSTLSDILSVLLEPWSPSGSPSQKKKRVKVGGCNLSNRIFLSLLYSLLLLCVRRRDNREHQQSLWSPQQISSVCQCRFADNIAWE